MATCQVVLTDTDCLRVIGWLEIIRRDLENRSDADAKATRESLDRVSRAMRQPVEVEEEHPVIVDAHRTARLIEALRLKVSSFTVDINAGVANGQATDLFQVSGSIMSDDKWNELVKKHQNS